MESSSYIRKRDFTVCGDVGICAMTIDQFVNEVFELPTSPVSATVELIGIPAVVLAKENSNYAEMYANATVAAIDGMPIVKIGKHHGFCCDRCGATDIMGPVIIESIHRHMTHFFYGGKNEGVLEKLRTNLEKNYPGIQIVGMYSPPFRPLTDEEDKAVCEMINDLHPDFLWVGIGAPKQEMWMWEHQNIIDNTVMLGVGAAFDFFAGTLKKAPLWMEKACLEWLYRLLMEPKRLWRRYILGGIKFMYYSLRTKIDRYPKRGNL